MSFTVKELEAAISDWEMQAEGVRDLFMDVWGGELSSEDLPTLENIGKLEVADVWGGEGDGAEIYAVIKIGDRYFQRSGYYSSWGSSDMDGEIEEVKPVQVMKTEYEAI